MITLGKFSLGTGDRFGHQGQSQLKAIQLARIENGLDLSIVWNKSHREHEIIQTSPESVRLEADRAVREMGWEGNHFVDADHINLSTVDPFLESSDFFTIDVSDFTGEKAHAREIEDFDNNHIRFCGELTIAGMDAPLKITKEHIHHVAEKYLLALKEAGRIYRHIESQKGPGNFITEVSIDETDEPQSPEELLFVLAAIAAEGIPLQTIPPKFLYDFPALTSTSDGIRHFSGLMLLSVFLKNGKP